VRIHPHLTFDGRCAEAFRCYERVLGGRLETMLTHGDSPIAGEVPAAWHDRILHATLIVGDAVLMGADTPPEYYEKPTGLSVALQIDDPAEAERVFHALAEDGRVTMPIAKTFWAERFGMLTDRFGTPWMINCAAVPASSLQPT
jgi:PhnB protein